MLYVEHLRDVDAATWDRFLLDGPGGGHVLQSYAWGEFKATEHWTPLRLALKDVDQVLGTAQVLLRRPPGMSGAIAYCPRGPWVDWSQPEHVRALLGGMEHFARRHGAVLLKIESELLAGPQQPRHHLPSVEVPTARLIATARRLRGRTNGNKPSPNGEQVQRIAEGRDALLAVRAAQACDGQTPGRAVFSERGYVKSLYDLQFLATMVVDLDRPPDEMLARMKNKWRYNINLARRKGVTVIQDDSAAGHRRFYEMYQHTAARDGFRLRPFSYFQKDCSIMTAAGHTHLFFACHEGRPLAGLMLQTFGKKAWYRHGASETEGRNLMPAHALQFHAMTWAWERGMTYYDMVAVPPPEAPDDDPMWGLYVFKAGFGSRPVEWAGCLDKVLDPRGYAWEALEPAYFRYYKWRYKDVMY